MRGEPIDTPRPGPWTEYHGLALAIPGEVRAAQFRARFARLLGGALEQLADGAQEYRFDPDSGLLLARTRDTRAGVAGVFYEPRHVYHAIARAFAALGALPPTAFERPSAAARAPDPRAEFALLAAWIADQWRAGELERRLAEGASGAGASDEVRFSSALVPYGVELTLWVGERPVRICTSDRPRGVTVDAPDHSPLVLLRAELVSEGVLITAVGRELLTVRDPVEGLSIRHLIE